MNYDELRLMKDLNQMFKDFAKTVHKEKDSDKAEALSNLFLAGVNEYRCSNPEIYMTLATICRLMIAQIEQTQPHQDKFPPAMFFFGLLMELTKEMDIVRVSREEFEAMEERRGKLN